jgi:hypothetical protein
VLLGFAEPSKHRINLAPAVCARLADFMHTHGSPDETARGASLAEAFVVLSHEAEHVRTPRAPEVEIECYALQDVRAVVRLLGGSRRYAVLMAARAWEIDSAGEPPYVTRACRDGGPLDRHPETDAWP